MKPLLLSIILFIPFALGARYYFVCQTLRWCDRTELSAAGNAASDVELVLPDGRRANLRLGAYAEGAATPPRSAAGLAALDSVAELMRTFDAHTLVLSAPLRKSEAAGAGAGYYSDLGVARAAAMAGELQRRGVPGELLELSTYSVAAGEPALLKLSLRAGGPRAASTGIPTAESLLDSTVLRGLRFDPGSTALSPDAELAEYAQALVSVMAAEPERSLTLIGHTDDRAVPEYNDSLGLWRAEAVARYFEQVGYDRPISVLSRGEREPVADNSTEEGRFANRRVEVRID